MRYTDQLAKGSGEEPELLPLPVTLSAQERKFREALAMKKIMLAALTAALLGTAAMVPQAEARCWVNAYGWHCWHPHAWWWHHRYWHPYAYHWHPYGYWHHHPYAWRY